MDFETEVLMLYNLYHENKSNEKREFIIWLIKHIYNRNDIENVFDLDERHFYLINTAVDKKPPIFVKVKKFETDDIVKNIQNNSFKSILGLDETYKLRFVFFFLVL